MKFSVEPWAGEFGSAFEDLEEEAGDSQVDLEVECGAGDWRPIPSKPSCTAPTVKFIDGVRRIDARVWIEHGPEAVLGICASCAAGVVCCDGRAQLQEARVGRMLITPAPDSALVTKLATYAPRTVASDRMDSLMNGLAGGLSALEVEVAENSGPAAFTVIDGPLRGRERIDGAIGYVKSHRVAYLPGDQKSVLAQLGSAERSPVFLVETSWTRYSWYLRLVDSPGHPLAGIVRCEAPSTLSKYEAIDLADQSAATLPQFSSEPHKDGRAPQNLYPIKGLEGLLRQRLGSSEVLLRSIVLASAVRGTEPG